MTDLYKMFGRSNKYSVSEYYPMTDLYKNVWTFEQMFLVLFYDRPVKNVRTFEQMFWVLSYYKPV